MDRGPLALVQDQRRTEADEAYMSVTHSEYTDVLLPTVDHSNFAQDEVQQKTLLNLLYMKLVVEHETSLGGPHNLFLEIDANVSTLGGYTAQGGTLITQTLVQPRPNPNPYVICLPWPWRL